MTTTLDPPAHRAAAAAARSPSAQLQSRFAAARVSFTWLGVRKSLSADQKAQAAESFGAEGQYLSAAKKLLDTRHQAFKAVSSVKSRVVSYWKLMSLPYPEPGLRLIRQQDVEPFDGRMQEFRSELSDAVDNLDN